MTIRNAGVWTLLLLLAGCASDRPEESAAASPPPPASSDWIEVPLAENAFREHAVPFSRHTLDVTVDPGPGLEVNLGMETGASVVYAWQVSSPEAAVITSEFHGHTERVDGQPGTLMFYRKASGTGEAGSLIAPFDGVHAWYFRNDSTVPIVIRLQVAGFYELLSRESAIVEVGSS